MYEIGQVTPLDALRDALQEGGTEGRATFEICQKIGFTEILVLGLGILVSDAPTDDSLKPKVSSFSNCNHYSRGNLYLSFIIQLRTTFLKTDGYLSCFNLRLSLLMKRSR